MAGSFLHQKTKSSNLLVSLYLRLETKKGRELAGKVKTMTERLGFTVHTRAVVSNKFAIPKASASLDDDTTIEPASPY